MMRAVCVYFGEIPLYMALLVHDYLLVLPSAKNEATEKPYIYSPLQLHSCASVSKDSLRMRFQLNKNW